MKALQSLRLIAVGLAFLAFAALSVSAEVVSVVRTRTETFKGVTLVSQTATHAFLKHSRGVANIRLNDLDADTSAALGLGRSGASVQGKTAGASASTASVGSEGEKASGPSVWQRAFPTGLPTVDLDKRSLTIVIGVLLGTWLFFSYCLLLICRKAGTEPGPLVWLPVLQMIPMFRAAGMSAGWLLAMCVPLVNLVALVLWSFNIAKARGKGVFTAILLILPVTNFLAFLYLAFSAGDEKPELPPARVIRLDPIPT